MQKPVRELTAEHKNCILRPAVEQVDRQYVLLMGSSHVGRILLQYLHANNFILAGQEGFTWADALNCLNDTTLFLRQFSCRLPSHSLKSMTPAQAVAKAQVIVFVHGTNVLSHWEHASPVPARPVIQKMKDVLEKISFLRTQADKGRAQIHISGLMAHLDLDARQLQAAEQVDRAAMEHPLVRSVVEYRWYKPRLHLEHDRKHLTHVAYRHFVSDIKSAVRLYQSGDW